MSCISPKKTKKMKEKEIEKSVHSLWVTKKVSKISWEKKKKEKKENSGERKSVKEWTREIKRFWYIKGYRTVSWRYYRHSRVHYYVLDKTRLSEHKARNIDSKSLQRATMKQKKRKRLMQKRSKRRKTKERGKKEVKRRWKRRRRRKKTKRK